MRRNCAAPVRQILRGAGWAVLALSVWPAVALWGLAIGITAWCGLLTCAALSLGQSLSLIEAGWPRPLVLLPAALGLIEKEMLEKIKPPADPSQPPSN